MKKVIVLWHNGGRLANQLWLYISVLAYCLEKDYKIENWSFFEYTQYFNVKQENKVIDYLFYKAYIFFQPVGVLLKKINNKLYNYLFRKYYKIFIQAFSLFIKNKIIRVEHGENSKVMYLPPSSNVDSRIEEFDKNNRNKLYLSGWLFRNPAGILKHRDKIINFFKPQAKYWDAANGFVGNLRKGYKNIVGVHIRKGDYKTDYCGGNLCFSEAEVNVFLHEYLNEFGLSKSDTCFVICSDERIDETKFVDLNVKISDSFFITDLFVLSLTDTILGSDSTFGAFASYYGNIPFVVFKKDGIDWNFYKNKNIYFENKYLTSVHY